MSVDDAAIESCDDVVRAYAEIAPLALRYWGPELHYGFWEDAHDTSPIEAATARLTAMVTERLRVGPGDHVLDLGCGYGRPAVKVARTASARVTAVDVDPDAVEAAAGHARRAGLEHLVQVRRCDGNDLPFPEESFDAVLSFESTPHFEISELYPRLGRLLRPGGRLVVETPVLREPMTPELRNRVADFFDLLRIKKFETAETHQETARRSGLEIVEVVDITRHVESSFTRLARRLRGHEEELAADYGAAEAGRLIGLFADWGRVAEVGAMIMVARRAPEDAGEGRGGAEEARNRA